MKYKQIWKTAASCLVAALMFPSCSDDEGGGGDVQDDRYRTLVVTINSRSNAEPVGTRALKGPAENEITTEADKEYERTIMSWWLIILKKSTTGTDEYTVERVLSSEGGTTTDPEEYFSTTNDTNDRFDTSIDVELEVDQTYRFYALANLEGLKNAETVIEKINSLEKDKTFDLTSLNAQLKDMPAYHAGEGGTYIPMSSYGYEQYVDENTSKLKDDIELIRLIGKVTLEVRNKTGKDLTLKKLQMGQFRSAGDIYLFPWDVNGKSYLLLKETGKLNIEGDIPNFPSALSETEGFTTTTFYSDATGVSIPHYDETNSTDTGERLFTCYVDETYNATASDPELQITAVTDPRRDENEKPSGFSFVRRNDWLQIPVQITNVTTRIEFDQKHMPIGGLPESLEFGKISVPIAYCRTTHGGDITVNFALTEVSGMGSNPQLSFYSGSYEDGTEHYTSAILKDNQNDILIHTPEDNDAAPWLDETENAIPVTAGQPEQGIIGQGSFTVTAQELAATTNGQAEIELRMVITDGTQYMTIPYTIYITNQSN